MPAHDQPLPLPQHSPRPFRIERRDSAGRPFILDAEGNKIARVLPRTRVATGANGLPQADPHLTEANAQLLTAAGDLLQAALAAHRHLVEIGQGRSLEAQDLAEAIRAAALVPEADRSESERR